jgi:hypothetical protein
MEYNERLKKLKMPTLKYRSMRGDMIEVFKIINDIYDPLTTVGMTSLPEFDLMFMFAVKSYLHSWCFQCSSRPISKFLTVFAYNGRYIY